MPKCFYFKIYHLQLSSKFVSPFVAHFSPVAPSVRARPRLIVIDWNYIFCHICTHTHTPPLSGKARTSLASFPASRNFKYSNNDNQELINSKSFLGIFCLLKRLHVPPLARFFWKFSSRSTFGQRKEKGNFFHFPRSKQKDKTIIRLKYTQEMFQIGVF